MISAKLIKALEREGFYLEFPEYGSNEEIILEILNTKNNRINLSLPLFLRGEIDYEKISLRLNAEERNEFDKIILISKKIYRNEKIENNLRKIIKENKIKAKFSEQEFRDYCDSFKESNLRLNKNEEKIIEKQSKLRLNLDLNKSLSILFSPAKIKIMEKIFNHQKLTNSELKYYYRAISNINRAVLNSIAADYLRVIELTKKES